MNENKLIKLPTGSYEYRGRRIARIRSDKSFPWNVNLQDKFGSYSFRTLKAAVEFIDRKSEKAAEVAA